VGGLRSNVTDPRDNELPELEAILGYHFRDLALLELALTHPSITHDLGAGTPHNQRLEFLGDAVLQLVLTSELYQKFPGLGEGPLTQARAEMVNRRTLASQSLALGIGKFLRLSRSEESTGGRERASALADAFEAVIGAIFMDGGLQELLQAESAEAPVYQLVSVSGPDHDRVFECAVSYRDELLGRGSGKTKKTAESEAARQALILLRARHSLATPPAESSDPPPEQAES
jgi:ribonuclease-3